MGLLKDGKWHDQWYDTRAAEGEFIREDSQFRNWITKDGSPGPSGMGGFAAEPGRYHLYVSLACPWAHRTLIFRKLKALEKLIGVSIVHPHMLSQGWEFESRQDGSADDLYGVSCLHQLYTRANPHYSGRVTVPVLWDMRNETIVSNESAEIIRMLNSAFDAHTVVQTNYYPETLRAEIDALNKRVYETVNNGVYRCGFASTQKAYEQAFRKLFETLDLLENLLSGNRYLCGSILTEADWRLFPTLIRFDAVYITHFKTNLRRVEDFHNLSHYVRDLYQHPGISETVNLEHIKQHYYFSHETINPHRIVPLGPELDFEKPHNRAERFA